MKFESVEILDPGMPLTDQVWGFVESEAVAALLDVFNLPVPDGDLLTRLVQLDAASDIWDFRRGQERNFLTAEDIDDSVREVVLAAAEALGLMHARPPRHRWYDEVLILGGLVRACFGRPAEASRLIAQGVEVPAVTALGAFRLIGGDEFDLASRLGHAGLTDEFEAMETGVRDAFSLHGRALFEEGEDSDLVGGAWRIRTLRAGPSGVVRIAAAPSTDPEVRRANTPDTYAWFAERLARLESGSRLLLVTSAIYVPFQHADAIRMLHLPYGVDIDTVGVSTSELAPPLQQSFGPHQYLQEVRSTIRALRALVEVLPV